MDRRRGDPRVGPLVDAAAPPVTLQAISESVSAAILEILRSPSGLDVAVGEFVIHDPTDHRAVEAGDVILAVGLDPEERQALALVQHAGAGQAAAVVFKLAAGAAPPALLDASTEAGVALLAVPPDVVWGQLHALLRTARAATGVPGEVGPGGAPVGDLFALANAVSSMMGGATTIEDPHSTVLAYSSTDEPIDEPRRQTILGRRVPDSWLARLRDDGVFQRLWGEGTVRVDYRGLDRAFLPRIAVAVRAGGEALGSIWVCQGRTPFTEEAEAALHEAARIAALHLLRYQAGEGLERRRRGELLRSVLDGRTPPDILASSLGIGPASAVTVVAFGLEVGDEATLADQAVVADRAVNLITVHCEAYRRQATSVAEGRVVYVLLPNRAPTVPERLMSFVTGVVEQITDALKVQARAGIGPTVPLARVLESRRDADRVLAALAHARHPGPVAHIDDVRSHAILLELRDLARREPRLWAGRLLRLVDHDRDRPTSYVATLRAYLDAAGDVVAAAASINVHPNTFRYRLRRLLELSGIDLTDPVERLVIHLQLMFLEEGIDR